MAGRVLRPLATITASARRISASSLHERLALGGPDDELKELGDTLDDLLARLEASFKAQRHFIANAAHELRTPLTAERARLQVALADPATSASMWRAAGEELLASNTEQAHLIDSLLALASSEGGQHRRRTHHDHDRYRTRSRRRVDHQHRPRRHHQRSGPARRRTVRHSHIPPSLPASPLPASPATAIRTRSPRVMP
jgi:signal transduction histidine kinase